MKKILAICTALLFVSGLFTSDVFAQEKDEIRAVMIISSADFRDEEFFQTRRILQFGGVDVRVASSSLRPSRGMLGTMAFPQSLLTDIDAADYDAVIFIGGTGAQEYFDDTTAHKIARDAASAGKVVGAICLAPVILANAGVLEGKRVTVSSSESRRLMRKGIVYTSDSVVVDGNIITADGPESSEPFGEAILGLLKKKEL